MTRREQLRQQAIKQCKEAIFGSSQDKIDIISQLIRIAEWADANPARGMYGWAAWEYRRLLGIAIKAMEESISLAGKFSSEKPLIRALKEIGLQDETKS